jgi:cyclase
MKRLIFTLLYEDGNFLLSRNFRLQKVGGIDWIFNNYDLSNVSHGLDELMVIDVSRRQRNHEAFADVVKQIATKCFIPVTVGGGIRTLDVANYYMRSGADKLLLNSLFEIEPKLCQQLADRFGRQCIVACIDYFNEKDSDIRVKIKNGTNTLDVSLNSWVEHLQNNGAGELLFQSIDRDGTGMGLHLDVIDKLNETLDVPVIVMGGVGKAEHIVDGLMTSGVDAVATANLFNFIGDAFLDVRRALRSNNLSVASWDNPEYASLKDRFILGHT